MSYKSCSLIVNTSLENVLVVIPVRNEEKTIATVNEIIGRSTYMRTSPL